MAAPFILRAGPPPRRAPARDREADAGLFQLADGLDRARGELLLGGDQGAVDVGEHQLDRLALVLGDRHLIDPSSIAPPEPSAPGPCSMISCTASTPAPGGTMQPEETPPLRRTSGDACAVAAGRGDDCAHGARLTVRGGGRGGGDGRRDAERARARDRAALAPRPTRGATGRALAAPVLPPPAG